MGELLGACCCCWVVGSPAAAPQSHSHCCPQSRSCTWCYCCCCHCHCHWCHPTHLHLGAGSVGGAAAVMAGPLGPHIHPHQPSLAQFVLAALLALMFILVSPCWLCLCWLAFLALVFALHWPCSLLFFPLPSSPPTFCLCTCLCWPTVICMSFPSICLSLLVHSCSFVPD